MNDAVHNPLTDHPITVLLVDDQAMIGEAVRRMLESEQDIRFHYCADPTTALAVASAVLPTVILQDLVMPQVDGLTLVRYFRANPNTRDVPLIVLSTKEEPRVKADAFACGANDYLVKLPDKLELIARIRYHSRGYISMLQRNEAFQALVESQRQLEIRNRFIRETFGRYLSDNVVSSLLETPEGLKLGGEKRLVTIMMADLRGFTSLSERMPPEKVVAVINNYLELMTEIIVRYNGTIDEFIGDAILVIFGAPIRGEDDAERAVACAIEMQRGMSAVNHKNRMEGLPEVEMGIGLNTGEVVVGNIGSKKRAKYGVVGSNVNLTSRIESYTVGGQIMISQATRDAVGAVLQIEAQMDVLPKGVQEPITIYEVAGLAGRHNIYLPRPQSSLQVLLESLAVKYMPLDGKHATGKTLTGKLVKLSEREAEIETSEMVKTMSDLKMQIIAPDGKQIPGDVYCKVRSVGDERFVVRFTALPDEAQQFLHQRLEGGDAGVN